MIFPVFQILFLLMPVAMEVSASMREDSPGGKKITADERKSFGKLLGARLLDDDIEDALDFPDVDVVDVTEELFSLKDIVEDVVAATRKDSPGGKRITKRERKRILEKLGRRLLDDEVEALLA